MYFSSMIHQADDPERVIRCIAFALNTAETLNVLPERDESRTQVSLVHVQEVCLTS